MFAGRLDGWETGSKDVSSLKNLEISGIRRLLF
jgi:hypothetical protein